MRTFASSCPTFLWPTEKTSRLAVQFSTDVLSSRWSWGIPTRALVLLVWLWLAIIPESVAAARSGSPTQPTKASKPLPPDQLNGTIEEVIKQREYTWRIPRDKMKLSWENPELDLSFLERLQRSVGKALRTVGRWIKDFIDWIQFNPRSRPATGGGFDWGSATRWLIMLLIVVLAGLMGVVILRLWKARRVAHATPSEAASREAAPDVLDEEVEADRLPESEWMSMARDLLQRGELRLALRAYYLANLAHLAECNLITIARFKSNLDYERELHRRGHALPGLVDNFRLNLTVFERVWYGMHAVSREAVEQFASNVERMKGVATSS